MRFINAHTFKPEEFWHNKVQPYAILSHRWGNSEISLLDMQSLSRGEPAKSYGFVKIKYACEQAIRDGYEYVWVDTCCINKDSSAELSEAINSMYRWYQRAAVCYVFLSDVDTEGGSPSPFGELSTQFQSSEWFDRGWTLQELLAPRKVIFYDKHWQCIGTKSSLSNTISTRTKIAPDMLCGAKGLPDYSIAQRMSWASRRVTTRDEDIAYCLLGIFDVNMPLLYGEGERAFIRLQEEIIKQSDDHSIFAWSMCQTDRTGLLSDSPSAFVSCSDVIRTSSRRDRTPYAMTNRGLSLKLMAVPWGPDTYAARLDCTYGQQYTESFGIFLRRLDEDDQYARVVVDRRSTVVWSRLVWDDGMSDTTRSGKCLGLIEINVRQNITTSNMNFFKERVNGFRIQKELLDKNNLIRYKSLRALGELRSHDDLYAVVQDWWEMDKLTHPKMWRHFRLVRPLLLRSDCRSVSIMVLGFDFDHNPVCFMGSRSTVREMQKTDRFEMLVLGVSSIYDGDDMNTFTWSEISGGKAEKLVHNLFSTWAIKGDRIEGLEVSVGNFGVLRIARNETEDGRLVWDVRRV